MSVEFVGPLSCNNRVQVVHTCSSVSNLTRQ